jgi:23S rRNA pseudouridine1911/1915/1917 synthase
MQITILYEDSDVIVINKPAGTIVNRAETVKLPTVADWMDNYAHIQNSTVGPEGNDFKLRSGVVHRIDKETSGCLVLAKNETSFFALQSSFKERTVKKMYTALVHGKLVPKEGEITAPIGRLPWNRERFGVVPGGKEAHSKFEVDIHYQDEKQQQYTLIHVWPTTGRTHQIRVHLKYLGFPIVGDYLYAGRKQQDWDRTWCPRVFLHAAQITFPHPLSEQLITVAAPLPLDLASVLSKLTPVSAH